MTEILKHRLETDTNTLSHAEGPRECSYIICANSSNAFRYKLPDELKSSLINLSDSMTHCSKMPFRYSGNVNRTVPFLLALGPWHAANQFSTPGSFLRNVKRQMYGDVQESLTRWVATEKEQWLKEEGVDPDVVHAELLAEKRRSLPEEASAADIAAVSVSMVALDNEMAHRREAAEKRFRVGRDFQVFLHQIGKLVIGAVDEHGEDFIVVEFAACRDHRTVEWTTSD